MKNEYMEMYDNITIEQRINGKNILHSYMILDNNDVSWSYGHPIIMSSFKERFLTHIEISQFSFEKNVNVIFWALFQLFIVKNHIKLSFVI